jgi:two-component system, NarL family, sensor kinase
MGPPGSRETLRSRRVRAPAAKRTRARADRASSGDFEFIIDRDWRVMRISSDAAAWFSSTPAELIGVDTRERWPPPPPLAEAVEAALASGATSTVRYASLTVPGRWVEVDVEPRDGGARIRFRDITAQVLAEQSLKAPDDLGYPSRGDAPAEIVLLDAGGRIVSANAAWRASLAAHAIKLADDGVGARYADVCEAAVGEAFDEVGFETRLNELVFGRSTHFEATYSLEAPHGLELRQVQIAPLHVGGATYFVAIHENLTQRARVLAELRETSGQLLHAQEDERRRIAVELHDSTSQHLVGMIFALRQLRRRAGKDREATALIDEMAKLAQQAIHETQMLSYLMNASDREQEGLETSARRFVEGFGRRTGLKVTFDAKGPVDAVSAAAQHAAFRVIQEALTNAYRHARGTEVAVSLVNLAGLLTLRIADDGQGIRRATGGTADEAPLGVGIPGMRARIEQLGGTLGIDSFGGGTVVTAMVPVSPTASTVASSE